MDTTILEEIGLTPGEIKVYIALLSLGPSSAGDIIERSHLQNSVVHFCLNKLREKGLVSYIKKGRIRIYQAADPENLLLILEERKKEVKKVLPELKVKQKLSKEKEMVELFEGMKGATNMFNQLIADGKKGDEYLFFSTDIPERNIEVQKFFKKYDIRRKEKGLIIKGLAPSRLRLIFKDRPYLKMRYVDFPIPANVAIFKDKMALMTFEEKPRGVLIKSKQIIDKQKAFFYDLWEKAKK